MLSDFQDAVREIVAHLPEAEGFALAGGAALIVSGVVDRVTKDLDYFTPYPNPVDRMADAARSALEDAGLEVATIRSGDTYTQLVVSSGADSTNIDLASDYRLMAAKPTDSGFVLDVQELAADKVLALEARGMPRDYIDFAALNRRLGVEEMCQLAAKKDTGFDPARLAARLRGFSDLTPEVFGLDHEGYLELAAAITAGRGDLDQVVEARGVGGATRAAGRRGGRTREGRLCLEGEATTTEQP